MAGFIALKSVHTLKVVFIFFIKHYHRQYYYPIIEFFQALHNGQGIKLLFLYEINRQLPSKNDNTNSHAYTPGFLQNVLLISYSPVSVNKQ